MGDATLCLPVFRTLLRQNPDCTIDFLSNPSFEPIFENIPDLKLLPFNVKRDFTGLIGLWKLFKILRQNNYDLVLDLHNSLRTRILKIFFRLWLIKFYQIHKEHRKKKSLLGKVFQSKIKLKHTVERYQEVVEKSGLLCTLSNRNCQDHGIVFSNRTLLSLSAKVNELNSEGSAWIGIAPFAQHLVKEIPFRKLKELIYALCQYPNNKIILFGAGKREINHFYELQKLFPKSILISSEHFDLREELVLMSQLHCMITMDSANLHLAELAACKKVISIWGPTHFVLGFEPFISGVKNIIEIPVTDLHCRPCSIYGNRTCHRKDHACMNWISITQIVSKIMNE